MQNVVLNTYSFCAKGDDDAKRDDDARKDTYCICKKVSSLIYAMLLKASNAILLLLSF